MYRRAYETALQLNAALYAIVKEARDELSTQKTLLRAALVAGLVARLDMTPSFQTLVEVALHSLCSAYGALVTVPFCSYPIWCRNSLVSHLYPGAQLITQHPIISLQHIVLNCEKPILLSYSFHLGLHVFVSSFQLFASGTNLFADGINLFA
uniref:Uncharacterized protein n=1 Tax=Plectus sambesii TaxID=2011161 RepID=A0A914V5U2_9BILA